MNWKRLAWMTGITGIALSGGIAIAQVPASSPSEATGKATVTKAGVAAFDLGDDRRSFTPPSLRKSDNPFPYRAVIRNDDRVPMMSREFPWSAVGRIEGVTGNGSGYSCTGTLIAKNVVLTNAHCVINPETREVSQAMRFKPNLINGKVRTLDDVALVEAYHAGTDFSDGSSVNDWALLKLDRPIGEKYGYLGWKSLPSRELKRMVKKLALVGYSGDFPTNPNQIPGLKLTAGPGMTAGVHKGCSVVSEQNGLLLHDCDTTGGASGGPILTKMEDGQFYIVALHGGWRRIDGRVLNYAVQMSQIDAWINAKRNPGK